MAQPDSYYRDSSNFRSQSHQLRVWIDDDPYSRGYAGMSDLQVADDMFAEKVDTQREDITGIEMFEQTDRNELKDLRDGNHSLSTAPAAQQTRDWELWTGQVADSQKRFGKSGPIVDVINDIWGAGSQTKANLIDYFQTAYQVDRGTWLINKIVTEQDVTNARAL